MAYDTCVISDVFLEADTENEATCSKRRRREAMLCPHCDVLVSKSTFYRHRWISEQEQDVRHDGFELPLPVSPGCDGNTNADHDTIDNIYLPDDTANEGIYKLTLVPDFD